MFYKYQKSTTTRRSHYSNGQKQGESLLKLNFPNTILDSRKFQVLGLELNFTTFKASQGIIDGFSETFKTKFETFVLKTKDFLRDYFFTFESKHNPLIMMHFLIFNSGSYLNSNIEKAGNWLLCLNSFFLVTEKWYGFYNLESYRLKV